jgi:hypothetical protein
MNKKIPTIQEIEVPKKFLNIYDDVSLSVQLRKARNYNLTPEFAKKCIEQLQKRPYYLVSLAKMFKIYKVGDAASGNPNHQAIIFGEI